MGDKSTSELDALKHRDWVRGSKRGTQCDTEDNTTVCLTAEDSVVVLKHARVAVVVCIPGTSVGAADEGAQAGSEAEEGAGAALQPPAHRVQPHTL